MTMFMAAFLPGILAVILFLLTIALYVTIRPEAGPKGGIPDSREFVEATIGMIPVLVIFGLVIGGIYPGSSTRHPPPPSVCSSCSVSGSRSASWASAV